MRQKKNSRRKRPKRVQKNPFAHLFRSKKLMQSALVHPSHETGARRGHEHHFERLEYLGDAVLGLLISHKLFKDRPKAQEGELSHLKSHWVSKKELAKRALKLKLGKWIQTSGQTKHENLSPKILADGLEALIGALYLDRGLGASKKLVDKLFPEKRVTLADAGEIRNPKGKLQELVQKRWGKLPLYQTSSHKKGFKTTIKIPLGKAVGIAKSKKESQEAAAQKLIPRLIKFLEKKKR